MLNAIGRKIPDNVKPFKSSEEFKRNLRVLIEEKKKQSKTVFLDSISDAFDKYNIKSNMCLSFHHHLRNGDYVLQKVCEEIKSRDLKDLHFAPSSIFPNYTNMVELIENQNITKINTNYINGPVADTVSKGYLKDLLIMNTHGGRARSIESGDLKINVAFLACPVVDKLGNGTGSHGKSACGTLGYAMSDLKYADVVILVTDTIVDKLEAYDFDGQYVDAVVKIDSIGDASQIVSGTTQLTKDPIGLKIAKQTSELLNHLGYIKDGMSMQTGAGKTSLAVVEYVRNIMRKKNIIGSFGSGGITGSYVEMLKEGLLEKLYDVQCFDLEAVKSYNENKKHVQMSASEYGNPFYPNNLASRLSFVILGAAEIDLNFNVNVTTDSLGRLIGGSGGHADIAYGADLTIIVSPLIKSRIPLIKDEVMTVTTPGSDVDILVTERGIAVNPLRVDLLEILKKSQFPVYTIKELYDLTHKITGIPKKIQKSEKIIGLIEYRDGTIIDSLHQI